MYTYIRSNLRATRSRCHFQSVRKVKKKKPFSGYLAVDNLRKREQEKRSADTTTITTDRREYLPREKKTKPNKKKKKKTRQITLPRNSPTPEKFQFQFHSPKTSKTRPLQPHTTSARIPLFSVSPSPRNDQLTLSAVFVSVSPSPPHARAAQRPKDTEHIQ